MFLLVGDVRHRAGGDQHRPRRQLDARAVGAREHHRLHVAEFVRDRLDRIHVLGDRDAFLQRERDLFVIQAIRRRILQALAIGERDAAPAADHVDEVRRSRPPPSRARARPAPPGRARRNSSRMTELFRVHHAAHARLAELAHQRVVAVEDLLDLDRVVGHQLGGGVDAGQAAADHDRGQPRLQVRQRVLLERAGQLQRHQEVAGLADAADQVVLDVDDRRPAGAGGDRDVIDPDRPRFVDRQRAAEAHAAVDLQLVAPRQRQVDQRQEVLVPAHGDAVLGHAAEAFEHALVERTIDLAPVADRARQPRSPLGCR